MLDDTGEFGSTLFERIISRRYTLFALFLIIVIIGGAYYYYNPLHISGSSSLQNFQNGNQLSHTFTISPSGSRIFNITTVKNIDSSNITYSPRWSCNCNASIDFTVYNITIDYGNGTVLGGGVLSSTHFILTPNQEAMIYTNGYWMDGSREITITIDGVKTL